MHSLNVSERDWLAETFEEHRRHLRAVAYRMLGSLNEADDAVQETWLRLNRTDASQIDNLDADAGLLQGLRNLQGDHRRS